MRAELRSDLRADLCCDLRADLSVDLRAELRADLRADLRGEIRITGSKGDLAKTTACIVSVLGDFEAEDSQAAAAGLGCITLV